MVFAAATTTAPVRDPAIMLFGSRIFLPDALRDQRRQSPCSHHSLPHPDTNGWQETNNPALVPGPSNHDETKEGIVSDPYGDDDIDALVPNDNQDDKKPECPVNDNSTVHANSDGSSQQKVIKKPDKILHCPRCNSLDTKFCYYNNYNVNQPRYYCKNCERYWTDGGTMRNVPVGAGRRKNKHSVNDCRNSGASSEGPAIPGINVSVSHSGQIKPSVIPQHESGNNMVLTLKSEDPHCLIEADPLNLGEQSQNSSTLSECQMNLSAPATVTEPSNDASEDLNANTYPKAASVHPAECYPGAQWAFLTSPGWNNVTYAAVGCASDLAYGPENGRTTVIPWNSSSFVSASALVSPTIPFSIIPASFWGCTTSWPTGAWNAPLVGYNGSLSLSSSSSSSLTSPTNNESSDNLSLKSRKRFRDGSSQIEGKTAASLWFPKTLRIDDPDQAAKSSIWATLGIKHDHSKPINQGTMFKCFQSDKNGKIRQTDAKEVLDVNPAALSRSQAFQETS